MNIFSQHRSQHRSVRIDRVRICHLMLFTLYIAVWSDTSLSTALVSSATTSIAYPVTVRSVEPHNPKAFTQGLIKQGDTFYESSGLYGRSYVQHYDGKHTVTSHLAAHYFAEGLTLFNGRLYLLTWKEETLLILNKETLAIEETLRYTGEGWGLTHNEQQLIMSNGSSTLLFRDPKNFAIQKQLVVNRDLQLNELEYVDGIIWANDWNEDTLYGISELNGCIVATLNLSNLRQQTVVPNTSNITNGIAYDEQSHGLWVTGKYWPLRYLIDYPVIDTAKTNHAPC